MPVPDATKKTTEDDKLNNKPIIPDPKPITLEQWLESLDPEAGLRFRGNDQYISKVGAYLKAMRFNSNPYLQVEHVPEEIRGSFRTTYYFGNHSADSR